MERTLAKIGLLVCALSLATSAPLSAEEKTKVGMLLPYGGVYAALADEIDTGFMIAIEEEELADQIEVFREDSEVKPPIGLSKTKKLVLENEVDVLTGIVSSGVLGAVRNFVHGSKTPLIVSNAGNNDATGKRCSPYVVRVSFSNAQITRPMGKWMAENGIQSVYTLGPDYAAGHQMIEAFIEEFKAHGGEVLGTEYTPFRNTQDFGPYLTKAQAAGADALFAFYSGGEAIAFVKQYGQLGVKEELPLYGAGFLTSQLYVEAQGEAAEGIVASLNYVPTIETDENSVFVETFVKQTGRLPSEFAVQGYDTGKLLALAIKSGATDKESIAKVLPTINYHGPRGPLQIDPATNNVVQTIYVYETVRAEDGSLSQKILGHVKDVQDDANGCNLL